MAVNNSFSYQAGPCSTNIPWHRPDPYNLTLWKDSLFDKVPNFDNYKVWMIGAAIESRATWDVDFIITGELENLDKLQEIMISMVDLGFKHRLLVDVWWSNAVKEYLEKGALCTKMQIACQEVIDTGRCSGQKCLEKRNIKEDFIIISNKVIKNGKVLKHHETAKRIHDHLWLCEGSSEYSSAPFFSTKHKNKIEQTLINKTSPILLTADTDFYRYINWP